MTYTPKPSGVGGGRLGARTFNGPGGRVESWGGTSKLGCENRGYFVGLINLGARVLGRPPAEKITQTRMPPAELNEQEAV